MNSKKFSAEEMRQLSLRMKSARMLTGLNQEEFAEQNRIALMSLKYWEMGKALPRREGILNYINAIRKNGIEVAFDWIFYGSGPGPTYINGTQVEKTKTNLSYLESQIELFKKEQLSKSLNPIVIIVKDDEMYPNFSPGDIIGGIYTALNTLIENMPKNDISKLPWLLMIDEIEFAPRKLLLAEKNVYYQSNKDLSLRTYNGLSVGKICWHYMSGSHT